MLRTFVNSLVYYHQNYHLILMERYTKKLNLHAGPNFSIPDSVSDDVLKFFLRQLPGGIPSDEAQLRPVARKSAFVLLCDFKCSI